MNEAIRSPEQAARALAALYDSCGYRPFRVQKFERYDLYAENKRFLLTEKVLTFTNTDGRLMAMKPDVTLSIVQNTPAEGLRKVRYHENVYREQRPGEGFREIPQTGLECIGALDGCAVGEVVMLAARSLMAIRTPCVLTVSHVGVVAGALEAAGLSEEAQMAVFAAVGAKSVPAIRQLCPGDTADTLAALIALSGALPQALAEAASIPLPEKSRAALAELSALADQLALYGVDCVRLDCSVVNDVTYYDNIVFRGYVAGASAPVLSGGRYDRLLGRMGKPGGAIGFAVYLDRLEAVRSPRPEYDADTLILFASDADVPLAVQTAEERRAAGERVRLERTAPAGLRFRTVLLAKDGEVRAC